MSDNDTVEGAAEQAAPEIDEAEAIWQRELERRKNPDAEVSDQEDDAAPPEAEPGTDPEAEAEESEPEESKEGEGDAPKDAPKPDTPNIDRLKSTINGQSRKINELQREIATYATRAKDENKDDITDLDGLKAEYPEVVGPLIDRLTRLEASVGDQHSQLSKVSELAEAQHIQAINAEAAKLDAAVPDWETTIYGKNRAAFEDWVNDPNNPRWVYDTYRANTQVVTDGEKVAELVSAFKQHIGAETRPEPAPQEPPPKKSSTRRLDGARATTSRGTQASSENDNGLTGEQLWQRELKRRREARRREDDRI